MPEKAGDEFYDRPMAGAVVVSFALLIIAVVAAIAVALATADADRWARHSLEVRDASARLFSLIQDAETGQRGFILTGDKSYLPPFQTARDDLPAAEVGLKQLTADNPFQEKRLDEIYGLAQQKLDELSRTVELAQSGRTEEAISVVRTNEGRDLMTRIRAAIRSFDNEETALRDARMTRALFLRASLLAVIILAIVIAGVLATLVTILARRGLTDMRARAKELLTEIGHRERAEASLRQAQKMEALGQLTGGVAHDFNNMLSIIVGNLDLLLRRLSGEDGRARAYAENALTGARRAAELTQRLLAFSRLQPLQPSPHDVNKCVRDMSELLRRVLGEGIELETVLGGGLWRASVDLPQLENAILNLVLNARDAMAGNGRLTIETGNAELSQAYAEEHDEVAPGQYVVIAVSDTGSGMTEEVMQKAFDPFFTTKEAGYGTGLGLSQVFGFVKQSRGHVKLYSEPGRGTTAKVYLPRDRSKPGLEKAKSSPTDNEGDPREHTVLVVEDMGAYAALLSVLCASSATKLSKRTRFRWLRRSFRKIHTSASY